LKKDTNQINGYTLIEIVVVISLISLLLFFAIPRFQHAVLTDSTKNLSRWIMGKVFFLKERSVRDQKLYVLNVGVDSNRLWVTHESMSEEELENAALGGYQLPMDLRILDVEFPNGEVISGGRAGIYFYKKGYSDKAFIHIEDADNKQLSFLIEPFLSRVRLYETYVNLKE
jgi:prepilin-type N-terminal cleavage/methylation domain-containing protein